MFDLLVSKGVTVPRHQSTVYLQSLTNFNSSNKMADGFPFPSHGPFTYIATILTVAGQCSPAVIQFFLDRGSRTAG
jgi:hypothetical protein